MFEAVSGHARTGPVSRELWQAFARRLFYRQVDLEDRAAFIPFGRELKSIERETGMTSKRVVYLATSPELFVPSVEGLAGAGLIPGPEDACKLRVVFEKPFGHDLESARELSLQLGRHL
jgi:glucose-6-phosphate 1-dehydrogenase